jgi:hypothetical protein
MLRPDRASANQFMEGLQTSKIISKIPVLGRMAEWYQHYLFHQYIPGLKFKTYEAMVERNRKVYEKKLASGEVTDADVKALSAEQSNAAYGHLNYADLGRNPTIQHILQGALLAPDFLEARGRFAAQAVKGAAGTKVGREQIIALATLAVAQAALAYTAAKTTGGEWDPKHPFEFRHGNRRYTMRSVPEDIDAMISDLQKFTRARLSPIVGKGMTELLTGVNYRGQKVTPAETAKELLKQPIPLTVRSLINKDTPLEWWEQLAGASGLKIMRYSPTSELYKQVIEFMEKSDEPRWKDTAKRLRQDVSGDSPYRALNQAVEKRDAEAFRAEYTRLDNAGYDKLLDKYLKSRYNPTTAKGAEKDLFSGISKDAENEFRETLTPKQQAIYDEAIARREEDWDWIQTTRE